MGTLVGVTLYARTTAEAKAGFAAAYGRIAALNTMLSDYLPDSEVSQLGLEPRRVSPELYSLLVFSRDLSEASGGAFDVTVGPLTRLWRARLPMTAEARALVDWREVHLSGGMVRLGKSGMRVDLGAIGKGYAADEALRVMRTMGISRALVAASGDIVCGEAPPGERGWAVEAGGRRLSLRKAAVSTSGDTTQFFVENGKRYSHILDPRKGAALSDVLEVSVVAGNGMTADALATTVRVMGEAGNLLRRYRAQQISPK